MNWIPLQIGQIGHTTEFLHPTRRTGLSLCHRGAGPEAARLVDGPSRGDQGRRLPGLQPGDHRPKQARLGSRPPRECPHPLLRREGRLQVSAQHADDDLPSASLGDGELIQTIEYPADAARDVRAAADGLIAAVGRYLGWARSDIDAFNATLESRARTAIQRRRERIRRRAAASTPGGNASGGSRCVIKAFSSKPSYLYRPVPDGEASVVLVDRREV
jgi:hypothetical protein